VDSVLILVYAIVGIAIATAAFALSRRIAKFAPSLPVRIVTSLIAGVLWPIVLVGVAQAGAVVLYVKYAKPRELAAEGYTDAVDAHL
jgi:hypothetical protein